MLVASSGGQLDLDALVGPHRGMPVGALQGWIGRPPRRREGLQGTADSIFSTTQGAESHRIGRPSFLASAAPILVAKMLLLIWNPR